MSTDYTRRPLANVTQDVATYAGWYDYASADVSIAGIFLDEMNNTDTAASLAYYQNATTYA